jgi:hypothetical protein
MINNKLYIIMVRLTKLVFNLTDDEVKICKMIFNITFSLLKKKDKVEPDLSSITDPSPRNRIYTIPGWFIEKWISSNNLSLIQPRYTPQDFFISLKMGPHGPSVLSMMESVK